MSEPPSVQCLLCEAILPFKDGNQVKFEKHMKNDHEMNTNQMNLFLSIHFLTKTEKDKLEDDMKIRIDIAMGKSTHLVNENISETKTSDGILTDMTTEMTLVKFVEKAILVENDIELIDETDILLAEEEDIKCSYDGVRIAKEHAISTFKDVFFNDAPIPKRSLQKLVKAVKLRGPPGPPIFNLAVTAFKKEKRGLVIKNETKQTKQNKVARKRLLSCEFCNSKFSWRKDYKTHVEKNHNSPVKTALQIDFKLQQSSKNIIEPKQETTVDNPLTTKENVKMLPLEATALAATPSEENDPFSSIELEDSVSEEGEI